MMRGCLPILGLLSACSGGCSGATPATDNDTQAHDNDTDSPGGGVDDTGDSGDSGDPVWPSGAVVLDHVTVFDALTHRSDAAVVLAGDEIWAVTNAGGVWPDDATVYDLTGHTIIPGLIDAHTHLFHSGSTSWIGSTLSDNLAASLAWGVVGVADLGSPVEVYALRDRIAAGEIVGPRIWATGPMLTAEGSHPCETVNDRALCRFIDGDAAEQVAALPEANGLKVALADADFTPWPTPRLDLGDLAEITAAASVPVWAHIDEPDDVSDAADAGVAVMAHPIFSVTLDEAPDVTTVSTFGAFRGPSDLLSGSLLADDLSESPAALVDAWTWLYNNPDALDSDWVAASGDWAAHGTNNLAAAVSQGRTVLAGSDAGYWFVPHGLGLHRELAALVEVGMSPQEALAAATLAPASVLGWDDLGLIASGYRADLLVLSADPSADIDATRQIASVWLGGAIWSGGDLLQSPAAATGGTFCLDDSDCTGRCDLVDHVCEEACGPTYDRVGSCDEDTWCMPADGLDTTTEGVCHPGHDCDLYNQDCEPASYAEACAPVDIDTNSCIVSGPRTVGQTCSWTTEAFACQQGLFCSWVDSRCYTLCDPAQVTPGCNCVEQTIEGQPWFGLCL
ncbi:MAG: imidazolonepropionase-like amidohydrolase [Myxococcota bacterium]|jgi:imidazolonepropionase-like amidohydrolase